MNTSTINAHVPPVGSWYCSTRPASTEQIARQSHRAYRAFQRTVKALGKDLERSHEADAIYRELVREGQR